MRHFGASVLVLLVASLLTTTVFAQSATTSLRGVVKDPTGALLPGAVVTLVDKSNGQSLTAKANSSGEYQLQQIPPAKYTITVTAAGFGAQSKSAELLVNQPATINFALTVSTSDQIVDVNATAQTLNTTDASLGMSKDNATIQALPSEERNIADLLSLQPGVFFLPVKQENIASMDSRSGSVNGGRSDQGNLTVDGVDDNDQVNGYALFGILRETGDSTEEFRVTTGDANADAGRSSGAQISLVTKSGTNKFHGAAYEYYRPTNTVANDYFNKQGQLASGLGNRPPKLIRHVFGADVGGPIVKDKLFFFMNYEAKRQAESAVVVGTTPTADYKKGIIDYQSNGALAQLSKANLATVDASNGCGPCNNAGGSGYTAGPGANPNALAYFNLLPTANGINAGDAGYTTGSYTFASPQPITFNTSIARIDYIPSQKHRIFVRGNLQKDTQAGIEQFPGQPASSNLISNNKGIAAGDTWTITSNIVNDIRYGYVRQGSGQSGVGSGDYVDFRFLSSPTAETRNTILSSPVNNIVDNLNMTKGRHSIQIGVNWRLVHQNRSSNNNSFNSASTNPFWLSGNPPDPSTVTCGAGPCGAAVDAGWAQNYQIAYANLVGTVPDVTDVYNYTLTSATTGSLLADGAPISRHFKANEYEGYVQDAWRVIPNLTITVGLRYTLLQTPWETKGQEVTPTVNTDTWFKTREAKALQGIIYEPDLTFAPAGHYYNAPGFYSQNKNNLAPRVAIVYAPDNKTSIRAGAGIYYDHFGEGLINIFDQNGEFGLSTSVTNPAGTLDLTNSPRYTSRNTLPFNNGGAPSIVNYPYTAPQYNFAITWGIDNKIKTPYSETMDLSVQRDLPKGFTLETAYVGRLGRHLLQSQDLAEPVDYVDPQGGGDYYTNAKALSKLVDANARNRNATVQAIPYFEHLFPYLKNFDYVGQSATQAIYSDEWAPFRSQLGATTALADIDFFCFSGTENVPYPCPNTPSRFWQDQFSSLYAQNSVGMSYYHSAQVTLRHPSSHGLQADVTYTYSRSIDFGSDAERFSEITGLGPASNIINTWNPALNKSVSDFNTTHLFTVDWVYQLPFGKGKQFFGSSGRIVNAIIGGWQSSGIFRWTSGLPFSFFEPGWTTDWQIESYGVVTDRSKVKVHKTIQPGGTPQYFDNASAINNGLVTGTPERLPYPGEAGQRNNFIGDGFINLDSSLSKSWSLERFGSLKFAWEVYNVTNTVRFDPESIGAGLTGGSLGLASAQLGDPGYRRMQFSLRYDF